MALVSTRRCWPWSLVPVDILFTFFCFNPGLSTHWFFLGSCSILSSVLVQLIMCFGHGFVKPCFGSIPCFGYYVQYDTPAFRAGEPGWNSPCLGLFYILFTGRPTCFQGRYARVERWARVILQYWRWRGGDERAVLNSFGGGSACLLNVFCYSYNKMLTNGNLI